MCVMTLTVPAESGVKLPEELVDRELSAYASEKAGRNVEVVAVRGECPGTILKELHGEGGFGYDPLFYYGPAGKTFAEMSHEEKNAVSHRGIAAEKFKKVVKTVFGGDANDADE